MCNERSKRESLFSVLGHTKFYSPLLSLGPISHCFLLQHNCEMRDPFITESWVVQVRARSAERESSLDCSCRLVTSITTSDRPHASAFLESQADILLKPSFKVDAVEEQEKTDEGGTASAMFRT